MSYEGSVQVLCKKGHYHTYNCYTWDMMGFGGVEEGWECPTCAEPAGEVRHVDQTNCECFWSDLIEISKEECEHCASVLEVCYEFGEPGKCVCGEAWLTPEGEEVDNV